MEKDTERHTLEWLRTGQKLLKEAALHFLTAREDEAKKVKQDRDEATRADRNKRAK
jgi:hypothetical protein